MKLLIFILITQILIVKNIYSEVHNVLSSLPIFKENSYFANIEILNLENNMSANIIDFGSECDNWCLSKQYVKINLNFIGNVLIYTNNEDAQTGYQKAGLISSCKIWRVPVVWTSSDKEILLTELENLKPTSYALPNIWRYIKDKNDQDDPNIPGDESWQVANEAGYTSLWQSNIVKDTTIYIYLCADFNNVGSGTYNASIFLDFVADPYSPTILHDPIKEIYTINNIVIKAEVKDNYNVEEVKLVYVCNEGTTTVKMHRIENTNFYEQVISHKSCYSEKIKYYIEATDGINTTKTPYYEITSYVKTGKKFKNITKGKLTLEDNNPYDGETYIFIPEDALSHPVDITIIQRDSEDLSIPKATEKCLTEKPVAVFEFLPNNLKFKKPVELCVLYYDLNNNGKVEQQTGTEIEFDESQLRIFYWDGFEWRPLGGNIDKEKNTITTKIMHFSLYAIFPARALSFSDLRAKEKIITPALRDGINDFATFDGLLDNYEIKIFDITGRLVKNITPFVGNIWDGTDELGNIVESGVYIYQIKSIINGETKVVSGTITVAK